jgi:hypothetical protein
VLGSSQDHLKTGMCNLAGAENTDMAKNISLSSLSVMCSTCLYRLESPWGLTVHIVSRMGQQIEVIYSNLLLINEIDLLKIEAF